MTDQIKMTNKARAAARDLCVSYRNYMQAIDAWDTANPTEKMLRDLQVWGRMLLEDQQKTGVDMLSTESLESVMKTVRRELEELTAKAA